MNKKVTEPTFIIVDLFCGAGGTTTGFAMTGGIAKVIACVNHDPIAIKSHWRNHPEVTHFEEDIRTLDLTGLKEIVRDNKAKHPAAKLILWASLECTNFSKAKGGLPRNADSRTLADHLHRYITAINPDYIQIENVVEFMAWGALDDKGKPISKKNGTDWLRWRREICNHGYYDKWREMNSADYGAHTSRNRLFGCFARHGLPITFPEPTHAKKVNGGLFGELKKWKPVKEVLDFKDEGESVFGRKKPLSEKTLERIYAGLIKYVANGDNAFLKKYYSGRPEGKVISIDKPSGVITTTDHHALVQANFISKYNGGKPESRNTSIDNPLCTITTENRHAIVKAQFIVQRNSGNPESKILSLERPARVLTSTGGNMELVQAKYLLIYYGNGFNSSIDNPCPTLTTKDRAALIQPQYFIDRQFKSITNQSVNEPSGTLTTVPKMNLVEATPFIMPTSYDNKPKGIDEPAPTLQASRRHHYLINPQYNNGGNTVDKPCFTLIARMDKRPPYLISTETGEMAIVVMEDDSEMTVKIKQFMAAYGLVDIKMRMLRVPELLKIQGFPKGYVLEGNQSDQKKFIGNSVVPAVVKYWAIAMHNKLQNTYKTDTKKN